MAPAVHRAARRCAAGLLALALLAGVPGAAQAAPAPSPVVSGTVPVPLPAGAALAPGTYQVVITGNGATVTTTVVVAGPAAAPAVTSAPTTGDGGASALPLLAVALLVLLAGAAVVLLRWRRPGSGPPPAAAPAAAPSIVDAYRAAVRLVDAGQYRDALPRLTRIEAAIPEDLRTECGFFIAFSLYQTLYLDEAEHRLAALHREEPGNADVAHLLARLRVQRRDFDGAEPVLETLGRNGRLTAASRLLYSIVEYQRALNALREGDIEGAATLFERVERLGDLRDRVPADLRNRHVLLGARALLDKDVITARSHFERLGDAADKLPPDRRDDLLGSAKLGLALAAWLDGAMPDVERLLVEAVRRIDPAAPLTAPWEPAVPAGTLAGDLEAAAAAGGSLPDTVRTLRDMHFLRGMAALRDDQADLAVARQRALDRLACARRLDHTFADVHLVAGLLWFHQGDPQRRRLGLAFLREARKRGARDPELVRILNRFGARSGTGKRALAEILDAYVSDPTVHGSVRAELLDRQALFGRVRDGDQRPDPTAAAQHPPTVAELVDRSELLAARLRLLATGGPPGPAVGQALRMTDELGRRSQLLTAEAHAVERLEAAVLALIGDALLTDDQGEER